MVGVLLWLSKIFGDNKKSLNSRKTFLPTGRVIVGCNAPAQANSERDSLIFGWSIWTAGFLGRCLRLQDCLAVWAVVCFANGDETKTLLRLSSARVPGS
jgi:hypothetical protein